MDWLLKRVSPDKLIQFIPIDKLIDVLTDYLASTVKNPNSGEAKRLFSAVARLMGACDSFLQKVRAAEIAERQAHAAEQQSRFEPPTDR